VIPIIGGFRVILALLAVMTPESAPVSGLSRSFVFGRVCFPRNSILSRTAYSRRNGFWESVLAHPVRAVG